jgi:hypothetical protein
MIQANKLPLFIIVLTLSNLALLAPVNAVDATDTFYGTGAGNGTTTGAYDSAFGYNALNSITSGYYNTASGAYALYGNTEGSSNTASGAFALWINTTGSSNTASGAYALATNTTGSNNTGSGVGALNHNTTGSNNLANGYQALYSNTTGNNNMATGTSALRSNTSGFYNMANGASAMLFNTTGNYNVAEGLNALYSNTIGNNNIAIGLGAGGDLTTGSYNIDIGNRGVAGESRTIRIGTKGTQTNTYVAGISGVAVAGGVGVIIDTNGHLGTFVSSARFKEEIKPMDKASEAILSLKPVTFRYKKELDPNGIAQFGLVPEEVEKVNPDLVARDEEGNAYTVRYEAVNAMLLNEFLKQHRKVEQLTKDFESKLAEQQKQIEALTAGLQKVSAQLALSKPAPQTVRNQ